MEFRDFYQAWYSPMMGGCGSDKKIAKKSCSSRKKFVSTQSRRWKILGTAVTRKKG
jgi:hypothetical protein